MNSGPSTATIAEEPLYDVAHLGHIELLTTDLERSVRFFTDVYGLFMVAETAGSVYLRAWKDYERTTLKLTAAKESGVGHVGWRTTSPQALERRVRTLEDADVAGSWTDGDIGHGRAYCFETPGKHRHELYFESERYVPEPGDEPYLPNQPQRFAPHGAAASRIDHLNLLAHDVPGERQFMERMLGFKLRERLVPAGQDHEVGAWLSLMTKAHDLALTRDKSARSGRLHHIAYAVDNREDVLRAADIFVENDFVPEFGPAKHSRTQGFFLYVIEPGGNRTEVFTGGIHIYAPDWQPVTWDTESNGRSTAWGLPLPDTFQTYATPADGASASSRSGDGAEALT